MLYRIEPKNADQKPDTSKPFSSDAHSQKHSALTTRMKSPSVRIVTGNVSRISTGRNTVLMSPSTRSLVADNARDCTGVLAETGDYTIIIDSDARNSKYTMAVSIK